MVLTHGWPGSFVEFLGVIDALANPDDPADAFHVVVPSLPGYGFSSKPTAAKFLSHPASRATPAT